jgi:hypothetical protein
LAAFLASGALIGYSNEAKQYMGDVLRASIIFGPRNALGAVRWTELSILGVCALFFSRAAVFVLAGAGLFLAITRFTSAEEQVRSSNSISGRAVCIKCV